MAREPSVTLTPGTALTREQDTMAAAVGLVFPVAALRLGASADWPAHFFRDEQSAGSSHLSSRSRAGLNTRRADTERGLARLPKLSRTQEAPREPTRSPASPT